MTLNFPLEYALPLPEDDEVVRLDWGGYVRVPSLAALKAFAKHLIPGAPVSRPKAIITRALEWIFLSQRAHGLDHYEVVATPYAMACPEGVLRLSLFPEEAYRMYADACTPLDERVRALSPAQRKRVAALPVVYDTSLEARVAIARLDHCVVIVGDGRQALFDRAVDAPALLSYRQTCLAYGTDRSPRDTKTSLTLPRLGNLIHEMITSSASFEEAQRWATDPWVVIHAE
jgi:hypothetical protein